MDNELKIGLIGLDTSHAVAFTRLLDDAQDPNHVRGGRVAAGYPGATKGWDRSAGRVDKFTRQLSEDFGVDIVDSPEAVAEAADLIFITAVDGRAHRAFFERVAGAGKPVFVDKPFATTSDDAQAMVDMAAEKSIPLMSCSALRWADPFQAALRGDALGAIVGIDVYGPMALEEALPGLFWYGCHGIEMAVAAMGPGCETVEAVATDSTDVHTLRWGDGRIATYRGIREGSHGFGATIHRSRGTQRVDVTGGDRPYYAGMLEAIFASLPQGRSAVPPQEMIEVVRLMEAGNQARQA